MVISLNIRKFFKELHLQIIRKMSHRSQIPPHTSCRMEGQKKYLVNSNSCVKIFQDDKMPLSLKRQVFDQCVLPTMTYGCQTWSLTKATTQRLRTAQRAMERKMLKAKLKDKIPCREIRAKTNIKDVVKFAAKQKWKWAGHVARLNDNRWTKRITDWQPRYGKRSRGRQVKRWRDDIVQMKGITWGRDAGQRDDWRRDAEGYILQWMDGASV